MQSGHPFGHALSGRPSRHHRRLVAPRRRAARATASGPLTIAATPDRLTIDGRAPARPDPALGELAALLHSHLVGELRVLSGADPAAWRSFLLLLGRSAEELLVEGGIARLWAAAGGQHVEIREIDYAQVLRERSSGGDAEWDSIIEHCLAGDAVELDDATVKALLDIASDAGRLRDLVRRIDEEATESGGEPRAGAGAGSFAAAAWRRRRGMPSPSVSRRS